MPNINDAFPSTWIRATDLKGQTHTVTIDRYAFEDMGGKDGMKPVLYFRDRKKGLVLNKTNGQCIGVIHGEEMTGWPGQPIELYPDTVMFQGQLVPCVRVRCVASDYVVSVKASAPAGPGDKAAAEAKDELRRMPADPGDLDDEIPF